MTRTDELEHRVATETWPDAGDEIRVVQLTTDDGGDGLHFTGYAAVFNSWSEPIPGGPRGSFREMIMPGAFTKSLNDRASSGRPSDAIKLYWNHNTDIGLASTSARGPAGRLELVPDDIGLRADARFLPEHRTYAATVAAGIADSMSFGFKAVRAPFSTDGTTRELHEVRLHEVSIVSGWPAYAATSATVRALAEVADVEPDELATALSVLREPDGRLTAAQHTILRRAIDAKSDLPILTHVAKWRSILEVTA